MATVGVPVRILRLDRGAWRWLESEASTLGATVLVLGTYAVLAYDRFGWPDFAVRPTTRLVLTGVYGWLWLALASWLIVRLRFATPGGPGSFLRLTGHAHLPLLLVALVIQVAAVILDYTNVARWPAVFAGLFWMPAMLLRAVAESSGLSLRRAAFPALIPYVFWVAIVGRHLWSQLEHLL